MSFQAGSRSRPFQTDITKFSGRVRGNRSSHACSRDRMQSEETMKFSDNRVTGVIQCLQQPHYHLWREIESRIIGRCIHVECVRVERKGQKQERQNSTASQIIWKLNNFFSIFKSKRRGTFVCQYLSICTRAEPTEFCETVPIVRSRQVPDTISQSHKVIFINFSVRRSGTKLPIHRRCESSVRILTV